MNVQESNVERNVVIFLPRLCNEPLWNASATWHTEAPYFGRCAERTVLLWVPCFVLWVTVPFYAFALKRRPNDPLPWSGLAFTKVMVMGILMAAAVGEGVWAAVGGYGTVTSADILAPPVLFLTYTLHLSLLLAGRRRGERSSGVLWVYLLVALVAGTPQFATAINTTLHQDGRLPPVLVATTIMQYLGILVLFAASCINDVPSSLQNLTRTENPNPEADASFLNRLLYFYTFPLVWRGWRRLLSYQELPDVLPDHATQTVYNSWQRCMDGRKESQTWHNTKMDGKGPMVKMRAEVKMSLLRSIWQQNLSQVMLVVLSCLFSEGLPFFNPKLVGLVITFMETPEEPTWHGYLYAVCLLVVSGLRAIFKNFFWKSVSTISVRVRTTLMAAVYNKVLKFVGAGKG